MASDYNCMVFTSTFLLMYGFRTSGLFFSASSAGPLVSRLFVLSLERVSISMYLMKRGSSGIKLHMSKHNFTLVKHLTLVHILECLNISESISRVVPVWPNDQCTIFVVWNIKIGSGLQKTCSTTSRSPIIFILPRCNIYCLGEVRNTEHRTTPHESRKV